MAFIAVMVVESNRLAKFAGFATRQEAQDHVAAFLDRFPAAFVVDAASVTGPLREWWIVGQTVTVVPVPPTPEEQQAATDEAAKAAVKADAFVQQFIAMTTPEVRAYVQNNTATLAAMRTVVERMAVMLHLLARREYR